MENKLYKVEEVVQFIKQGRFLSLAGDERVLSKLPNGNWIGGTTPYFMGTKKGMFTQELIFVNNLSDKPDNYLIKSYSANEVMNIVDDTFNNGCSTIIVPPFTDVHKEYALRIPEHENLFDNPITGWVAGIDINSNDIAKTYNGLTGEVYTDKIVAFHIELPKNKIARLEITNIFSQSDNNIEIEFLEDGFCCTDCCLINGKKTNLAKYIKENNIDIKLPIISDYSGALINVSFQSIENDKVKFYAPIFKGRKYKFANPITNYVANFNMQVKNIKTKPEFSCNCILNYLYGELEGKKIDNVSGPITFGEIGYLLLNQTLTFLFIEDK